MSFHGYSDDEESPVLRDFVNETNARQTETPSPRTELLSPTSPRAGQGDLDRGRRQRGPSERYRRQREQAYANVSPRQLLSTLIEKEYESNKLRKALHRAFDRVEAETARVVEAERVTRETLNQFRAVNDGKVKAERELFKTTEELRLWKFQFDHAQREIKRAQEVVQLLERQRDDAEEAAAEARTAARALNEQRLVSDALEEGRRLGYKAGFRRAQQEMAINHATNPEDVYQDMEREIEDRNDYSMARERDSRPDGPPPRDVHASPMPAPRTPHIIHMPEIPRQAAPPDSAPAMPTPNPALAMPSPISRPFETESVRRAPPSARSPSIQLSHYAIEIPPPSAFNELQSSRYPQQQQRHASSQYQDPPLSASADPPRRQFSSQYEDPQDAPPRRPSSQYQDRPPSTHERRPSSQYHDRPPSTHEHRPSSQYHDPPPGSPGRPIPQEQPQYQPPPPVSRPPDNYIPSISAEGGIALPPPFQLAQHILAAAPSAAEAPRTQSWYNREGEAGQTQSSWYQPKRPRSNAGSVTGRSNAGSVTGRSNAGSTRHTRHASLDSHARAAQKNQRLGADYGADLGAIKEDMRSAKGSPYAYAVPQRGWDDQGAQRARSMRSSESLAPPPPPPKDPRHQKQAIADELRYSDPDLPEAWRRDAAVNAETSSSRSRPPRNVRVPTNLTFPAPLSPPDGTVPLGQHMRARSMSGSTGRSGWSQRPNIAELVNRPSLRRVKEKRPISPTDIGSPYSGTINVEPPSQSFSQMSLQGSAAAAPQMDRYLSPNYPTQQLPQTTQNAFPSGFQPQSVTVPVTFKGKVISSPVLPVAAPVAFPTAGGGEELQPRPPSGLSNYRASAFGGSNTSLNRGRSNSGHAPAPARPLSAVSNSNLSRKSGRTEYVAGPMLTADGPTLTHRASNTSLRSTGSGYGRFDAESYVDPAYFATAGGAVPIPAPRSRKGSASTAHSGLSYVGPPQS